MGSIHNELRRTQLSHALTRAIGDTKGIGGIERYGETLTPIIDLWGQREWAYLRGELNYLARDTIGATAGEYSGVALVNGTLSNKLVIVEACHVFSAAAYSWLVQLGPTASLSSYAPTVTGLCTDSRAIGIPHRAELWGGSDPGVALATTVGYHAQGAGVSLNALVGGPIVLVPGRIVLVTIGTVNIGINVTWAWRERVAYPGELE